MNNDNTMGFVVTFIIVICLFGITNIHILNQFEDLHQDTGQDLQKELEFCQRNIIQLDKNSKFDRKDISTLNENVEMNRRDIGKLYEAVDINQKWILKKEFKEKELNPDVVSTNYPFWFDLQYFTTNQNIILCENYLVTTNNIQTIVDGYTNTIETGSWEVIETYTGEKK